MRLGTYLCAGMKFSVKNWTVRSSHNLDGVKMLCSGEPCNIKKLLSRLSVNIVYDGFGKCENGESNVVTYYYI